jgi:regulator of protease activity HflC (stomatin/prohibitin superfamily)
LVELKDVQLPDSMKRAMAGQAEAEREKRAKIINAEGESLAAAALGSFMAREKAAAKGHTTSPQTVAKVARATGANGAIPVEH